MKEKAYTLTIRQTGTDQYEVTRPEIGATKTAAMLESALTLTVHDILKHLTTRSLILVFADQHVDRDGGCVDPQECSHTALEQQAVVEVAQLGIAPQVKRKERHLVFELSRPLTRAQARWLDELAGKLFKRYSTKNELAVQLDLEFQLDVLLEAARDNRKAAAHE